MGLLLKQFYRDLLDDYREGWRSSFLFQYLREEREEERSPNQKDSCSQLKRAFSETGHEEGRRAYFLTALKLLEKSRKPLLPGGDERGQKDGKALLLTYAHKTGEPGLLSAKRWDRRVCRLLLDFLEQNSRYPAPDIAQLRLLHNELTDGLLRREAEDYLYNLENGRKSSRDMAILEAYLNASFGSSPKDGAGISAGLSQFYTKSGSGRESRAWNEERIAQLQIFYEDLKGKQYEGALIPICIDPLTGAGLYFIGNSFFQAAGIKNPNGACLIACLYTNDLCLSYEDDFVWSTWHGYRDELERFCGYPNVAEALKWFESLVKDDRKTTLTDLTDFLEYFQDGNGTPPSTCPPEFLRYFSPAPRLTAPQLDRSAFAKEGRDAWLQEGGDRGMPGSPAGP